MKTIITSMLTCMVFTFNQYETVPNRDNNVIYQDTLTGFINSDNIIDSVYIRTTSTKKYEENDGISECIEQRERADIKIVFGQIMQPLTFTDEIEFDYPYTGYSSLSYELGQKGLIIRKSRSSRHSDRVYVDAIYEYDNRLKNLFKIKETTTQYEGGEVVNLIETTDSIQTSIDETMTRTRMK